LDVFSADAVHDSMGRSQLPVSRLTRSGKLSNVPGERSNVDDAACFVPPKS
jgi:hypothetical protein